MEFILADILFSLIGRICLYLRYWKPTKVNRVLIKEYEGSFTYAGKILIVSLFNILFFIGLIGLLLAALLHFIMDL